VFRLDLVGDRLQSTSPLGIAQYTSRKEEDRSRSALTHEALMTK